MGIEKAIQKVKNNRQVRKVEHNNNFSDIITDELIKEAKFRRYGHWFKVDNRNRLLESPKNTDMESESKKWILKFVKKIINLNPKSIIDLASGGGNGISNLLYNILDYDKIISVERDIKCTWTIQYRLNYLAESNNADAIAGDIRYLPIKSESFDTAMIMNSLMEIVNLSEAIKETYRILKKDGYFVVLHNYEPTLYGIIELEDYCLFAKEADLYSSYDDFVSLTESLGFRRIETIFTEYNNTKSCISVYKK